MKNLLTIILMLSFGLNAQNFTYTNQLYLDTDTASLSSSIVVGDDGYYIAGASGFSWEFGTFDGIELKKTDFNGKEIWNKMVDYSSEHDYFMDRGDLLVETDDDHLLLAYYYYQTGVELKLIAALMKIDKEGQVQWQKNYGELDESEKFRQIVALDEGYLIVGEQTMNEENQLQAWVLKVDSEGEVLWEQTYRWGEDTPPLPAPAVSKFRDAVQVNENSCLLMGVGYDSWSGFDTYAAMLDINDGSVIWENAYDFDAFNSLGGGGALIKKDNSFLLLGYHEVVDIRHGAVIEIDMAGNLLKDTLYDPFAFGLINPGEFGQANSITSLSLHATKIQDKIVSTNTYFDSQGTPQPFFTFLDMEGNLEEVILYEHEPDNTQLYSRQLFATPDGGIGCVGFQFTPPQGGWLITMDREGNYCEEIGCVETVYTNIEPVELKPVITTVSPNPAKDYTILNFSQPMVKLIKLYDSKGCLVLEENTNGSQHYLDINFLSNGIYVLLSVNNDGSVQRQKLVVQR